MFIRVVAKTKGDWHRVLTVAEDGCCVHCTCDSFQSGGHQFCSHIDAVLIAGEREMVVPDDRDAADEAMKAIGGRIGTPLGWMANWRKDKRWRGLANRASRGAPRMQRTGGPLVCFTGLPPDGRTRAMCVAEAVAAGWDTVDSPSRFTDVLVAIDAMTITRKLAAARQHGTAIVSYDEWANVMVDGVLPRINLDLNAELNGGGICFET